ncbi:MAG: cation:proton antiporter [Acidobacteria bacterium]|nr:cation:proton antiporter [Acidobacteriota bacterium]
MQASGSQTLILIAAAAFVIPLIGARVRLPAVVLEMSFGLLIGPVLQIVGEEPELIQQLGEIGFLLLMFLSGFEIDLGAIERQGPRLVFWAVGVFVVTLVTAFIVGRTLGFDDPIFAMLLLAPTSVGIVVPTLRETGHGPSKLGQAILLAALVADLFTLIGLTTWALIRQQGAGVELLFIPAFFTIAAISLLILKRAAWWYPEKFERLFGDHDPAEMGIRASLAFMLVFVGLAGAFGIEAILGAFLAGAVFAMVFRERGALDNKLFGFSYGFLIPIFFINVGIEFDLDAMSEPGVWGNTLKLVGASLAVKMAASTILFFRGFTVREVLSTGFLLWPKISLLIAIEEVGRELGIIDPGESAGIILLAALSAAISPILFRAVAPKVRDGETPSASPPRDRYTT